MLLAVAFVSLLFAVVDPYEPNDDPSRAPLLSDTESIEAWISPVEDVDWYQIVIAEPGLLEARLTSLPADYDIDLYWFDPSTLQLVFVDGSAEAGLNEENVEFAAITAGSCFLSVHGGNGAADSVNPYLLSLTRSEIPVATVESTWGAIKALFRD